MIEGYQLIEGGKVLDHVEMTWLGQAGFLLKSASSALAIDPFLSEHELRLYPPPPLKVLGGRLDYLLVTHEHLDHLDVQLLPALVAAFPTLTIVVPSPVVPRITGLVPKARVIGLQPGETVTSEHVTIRAVSAIHARAGGEAYSDGRPERDDPTPFLGYVLLYRGLTVYHAGDTLASQQLIQELSAHAIDVAMLPVNGRDYFRELAGIAGNLNPREAVELAAAIGADVLVPMHHDLFRGNTERVGACADLVAELQVPIHVLSLARLRPVWLPLQHDNRESS
jgi:L-ascorbate metabolism protein UlaG (beta-lactamase superfamily)